MEIKEGMYIRTREGIRKITDIWEDMYELNRDLHNRYPEGHCLFKEDIDEVLLAEPSFDIIDVIEPGDYVNGYRVINAGYNKYDEWCVSIEKYEPVECCIYPHLIETIVTKEQFAAMAYEVK